MKAVLRFLQDHVRLHSKDDVKSIIRAAPSILGLDVQRQLKPKCDYFVQKGWADASGSVADVVLGHPIALLRPLDDCIAPRMKFLEHRGDWTYISKKRSHVMYMYACV